MRSWKAGLPFATRARTLELSIQEVRIENESDRKYSKSKNFRSFSENHFYPRFMLPCSLLAENIFLVFQSPHHPSIHYFGLEASPGNAISEGRPPLCNTSSEAELSIREVRIENESDRKYSKSKKIETGSGTGY